MSPAVIQTAINKIVENIQLKLQIINIQKIWIHEKQPIFSFLSSFPKNAMTAELFLNIDTMICPLEEDSKKMTWHRPIGIFMMGVLSSRMD